MRRLLALAGLALFIAHQDEWLWDDATLAGGFMPVGFLYHVLYCLAAAVLLMAWILCAWPEPEAEAPASPERAAPEGAAPEGAAPEGAAPEEAGPWR